MPRFTLETPNFLIYLGALFRPTNLRPHLRVPNIASVDFVKLKQAGFNAVVIDKDNCLTIPDQDTLYPPLSAAWSELRATFPGRVLVVSNSAGLLPKDPGAIGAESVSLNLQAPVLVRKRAKPGCAKSIISYFQGQLGKPTTLRGRLLDEATALRAQEVEDELDIVKKWEKAVTGPILGPLVDKDGKEVVRQAPREKRGVNPDADKDVDLGERMRERQFDTEPSVQEGLIEEKEKETPTIRNDTPEEPAPLRILVIGDRMMTDTLLANRLAKLLPTPTSTPTPTTIPQSASATVPVSTESGILLPPSPSTSSTSAPTPALRIPSVISIHTTLLPQPKDVRLLRWLEERLSAGRVRAGPIDWARYTIPTAAELSAAAAAALPPLTWRERINPFRDTPPLTWHPRSWRPAPLAVGLGSGLWFLASIGGRGLYKVASRAWEGEVEVAKALAERAGAGGVKAEAKQELGKIQTAEAILEKPAPSSP